VDLDSVLTDFDKQLAKTLDKPLERNWDFGNNSKVWKKIESAGSSFWSDMDWMPDGHMLWDEVKKYSPTILSSPTNHKSSIDGKKEWLSRELPSIPFILESEKEKYAEKDSILIDDRKSNIEKWEKAGGIGLLHKDSESTISELSKIMSKSKTAMVQNILAKYAAGAPRSPLHSAGMERINLALSILKNTKTPEATSLWEMIQDIDKKQTTDPDHYIKALKDSAREIGPEISNLIDLMVKPAFRDEYKQILSDMRRLEHAIYEKYSKAQSSMIKDSKPKPQEWDAFIRNLSNPKPKKDYSKAWEQHLKHFSTKEAGSLDKSIQNVVSSFLSEPESL